MNGKIRGLFLTGILSFFILIIFFGKILHDPGNFYFSPDGDGFKAYFGAMYHMENDTSLFRMDGMNYPFGEVSFFTGCQPFVADGTKLVNSVFGFDISVVAVMNLLMVFSILIAAMFLYLLFFDLGLPWWYSALVALGISILSPQVARMGGHFSLAYVFWIPAVIYLLLKFDRKESLLYTTLIALVTLSGAITQLYFVGFFGFITGLYWFYRFLTLKKRNTRPAIAIMHFFIQFVLPVILVQLLMKLPDHVTDRTAFPFGFFEYRGHPVAVFLPSGRPYGFVREVVTVFNHIQWEALSFIGVAALIGFFAGLGILAKKIVEKKAFYNICDVPVLTVFFWSSVVALLFSFGIPFIMGMEGLVDYIGPLKQLRALARFSWFFFYILNIVVFYSVYKISVKKPDFMAGRILLVLALFFLLFDGLWNVFIQSRLLQNRWPSLEDKTNISEENNWVKMVNPDDYQAILPLPYFHVGSENIWIESKENTQELAMVVSLKTGLPMTAVQLSRTSIGQTFMNYQLVTEPLNKIKVLDLLPNEKPFLLLFNKKHYPSEDELRLIQSGEFIFANNDLELRKLPIQKLRELPGEHISEILTRYGQTEFYEENGLLLSDSTAFFIRESFNSMSSEVAYEGEGSLTCAPVKWNTILEDTLENVEAGKMFVASFWIYDYLKDGNLRINLEFYQSNLEDGSTTNYIYTDVHRHIRAFDGDWALIEFPFETKTAGEKFKFSLRSTVLKHDPFIIDELQIREEGLDLFQVADNRIIYNSRILSRFQY